MEEKRFTPMTTAGCLAAVMLIMALLSTYVPFFSLVGYFIMPIPIAIVYMRFGLRWSIMLGTVVGVLMGMFITPLAALLQFAVFSFVGLALGIGFKREWAPAKMLTGVTAALALAFIILMGCMYVFMGIDAIQMIIDQFQGSFAAVIEGYKEAGMSEVEIAQAQAQIDQMVELLPSMLPLLLCLSLAIISYLNIKIAQNILNRLGYAVKPFLPVRYWEISRSMLYLYILATVMKYWGSTRDIGWLDVLGVNLGQLAIFFICIQGIAFVLYLLYQRVHLRPAMQVLITVLLLVIPGFQFVTFLAGLTDMLINYRKKREQA